MTAILAPSLAQARPVRAEDLFRLSLISDPNVSPNGNRVAFVVQRLDGPKDRYDSDIWIVSTSGGTPVRITRDGNASTPRWSPSSEVLLYVDAASGIPQIFAYNIRTSLARRLTLLPGGASSPVWSHDGKRIAFVSVTKDPQPPAEIDFKAAGFTPAPRQRTSDVRTIRVEDYEANDLGYTYNLHSHVWVMNANGTHAVALTSGHRWSENSPIWSPDDRSIAFTSLRKDTPTIGNSDIYVIRSRGGRMRKVPFGHAATTAPVFGPDGTIYALSGGVDDTASYPALVHETLSGNARRIVVAPKIVVWGDWVLADLKMPGAVCGPWITPDGRNIVTDVAGPGITRLVRVDTATGAIHDIVTTPGEVSDCTLSANGRRVAYAFSTFASPAEVYVADVRTGTARAVTHFNAAYLRSVTLSTPHAFTVTDPAGMRVHAWFFPATTAGRVHPTLVEIHGGPEAEFGDTFFHEVQFFASSGYNVVLSDPRGSIGFGYPFEESLVAHWGDRMFDDEMTVVDAVVKRPDVDASQLFLTGGSYGGYATLWVISHTDRFRAAIAERVASDLATEQLDAFFASSNGLGGQYAWGKPWVPGNRNAIDSPLTYVENVHTPLMLLHSTLDTETPLDQTLDEFSALKELGRTVTFVEFPGETHDLNRIGRPIHRVERLNLMRSWFNRYRRQR